MTKSGPPSVITAGHLFSSIGMGEQARAGIRSLNAVGLTTSGYDIYRHAERSDEDIKILVTGREVPSINLSDIRVFHINGDEVDSVLHSLIERKGDFSSGYNIIMPAWELPRYPEPLKRGLEHFDEIWAISRFTQASLSSVGLQSHFIGQSVEADLFAPLPRRYFGIRESAFVLLSFMDLQSYTARKNPAAVVELYSRLRSERRYDDIQLVLKVRSGEGAVESLASELDFPIPKDVLILNDRYSSFEIRSLISSADCLVSLHRSEGFGRGLAEAMFFGRIALGTGWSGNTDYMDKTNSLPVDFDLVPVGDGQYPYGEGQQWAEPDVSHALWLLCKVIDDSNYRLSLMRHARISSLNSVSNRAVGLRMLERVLAVPVPHRG